MSGDLEQKLKALISAQHRLSALANLYEMQPKCASDAVLSEAKARLQRLRHILRGIDTLLLLVPEEERYILELHPGQNIRCFWDSNSYLYPPADQRSA